MLFGIEPPYYAVIFTSVRTDKDQGYEDMAQKMFSLAQNQVGFLGVDSAREIIGITVSYWSDMESIVKWKENWEHVIAQKLGKEIWYKKFSVRIAKVEREYHFENLLTDIF